MTKTNNSPAQTHCHCCRPLAGVNHSACGAVAVDAAGMAALNNIAIPLPARKVRR